MSWRRRLDRSSLERTQWDPPEKLRALQQRRLIPLIRHVYGQSPYYTKIWSAKGLTPKDMRTLGDLDRLPVISRQEILEHAPEILARNASRFRPAKRRTGGTTGAPLQFFLDQETLTIARAVRARFRRWAGIQPGDRIVEFRRPGSFRLPSGDPDYQTLTRFFPEQNLLRFNLLAIRTDRLATIADELQRFQPEAIVSSTTVLSFVSQYLVEQRTHEIRPRAIFAGGERLFPEQRQLMAEAFGAPVFETYGNNEAALMGGECEKGHLHLAIELSVPEILKGGRTTPPGEMGEAVLTNLWNRSFPFIRYAIGDVAQIEATPCPCGRGLPTARIIGGKILNLLATPQGYLFLASNTLSSPRWRGKIAGIRYFQETKDAVTVQVVRGPMYADSDERDLIAELDRAFQGQLRISVEYFESLEHTPGGKYRYIVSKVPVDL